MEHYTKKQLKIMLEIFRNRRDTSYDSDFDIEQRDLIRETVCKKYLNWKITSKELYDKYGQNEEFKGGHAHLQQLNKTVNEISDSDLKSLLYNFNFQIEGSHIPADVFTVSSELFLMTINFEDRTFNYDSNTCNGFTRFNSNLEIIAKIVHEYDTEIISKITGKTDGSSSDVFLSDIQKARKVETELERLVKILK